MKKARKTRKTPNSSSASRLPSWANRALAALQTQGMAFLIVGALAMLAAGTWYAINRSFDDWVRWLLVGGLGAIAAFALLRPQDVQRVLTGRSMRYGSNALVLSIAAIGIVVLLNYLSNRYYKRFDTTEANLHTLSPQSIQVLKGLDQDIDMIGFYPGGQGQEAFETWIDEYQAHTDRLQYRSVDPIRQPGETEQLGWDSYGGGLLVRRGPKSQEVLTADEQDITSAILKVSRDTQKVVYFVTGHGERSTDSFESSGYGEVGVLLTDNNYQVKSLNLAITDTVPADAAVVVIAGPKSALLTEERGRLTSYLLQGGKALIMIDPGEETQINDLLAPWKVRIENQLVVDPQNSLGGDPVTPVIDRYRFDQITKDLPMIALPLATHIQSLETIEPEILFSPLATSSSRSWAETDLENLEQIAYDEGTDLPGPLNLIVAVESPSVAVSGEKTRLVLIGDSDFLSNEVLRQIPNGQFLLLNAVNWLAEEEALIAIGPKANLPRSVQMNAVQEGAVCFGTLVFIPAVIVAAGVIVWLKRR